MPHHGPTLRARRPAFLGLLGLDQCLRQHGLNTIKTQEVAVLAVKSGEQGTELLNRDGTALMGEAVFVDFGVEQARAGGKWKAAACLS